MIYIFLYFAALIFSSCYANTFTYEEIANVSVNIAQASYCVDKNLIWDCPTCYSNNILTHVIEKDSEQVIFGYNQDYNAIFIAFRGSSNIENWLANIQFHQIQPYDDENISVEKGFYNLYADLKPIIYDTLQELASKYSTHNVLSTGHSLGGALATLFAFDNYYYNEEYNVIALMTFGSPRIGNHNFVTKFANYNMYSKRITHYYDMVPHVPQNLLHYYHIPNEVWYNENNDEYKICLDTNSPYNEDSKCSDSCSPTHCTSTSDHLYYLNVTMGSGGC